MKKFMTLFYLTSFLAFTACAQNAPSSPREKATGKAGNTNISIDYGAPSVKGRKIYGDLVPFGKVWRTGANEATSIEFDNDVKIEGQSLPKGKYALFTIPGESEWTIIFNKSWKEWGAFRYKQEEDVLRVKVKPSETSATEKMTFTVANGTVQLSWEKTKVSFKVQ
ncbi:MAG: DUF2911 domain-containing protein [Chitinophagaceae bacterium]